jgi:hypothetical protein
MKMAAGGMTSGVMTLPAVLTVLPLAAKPNAKCIEVNHGKNRQKTYRRSVT